MADFETGTTELLFELKDKVAVITMNRPTVRNALSPALTGAMRQAIRWAASDDRVGALLITGAGIAFCAGGDVKAMGERPVEIGRAHV